MNLTKTFFLTTACSVVCMAAVAADPVTNKWEGTIGAGLTVTKGNSDTVMANLNAQATRKWYENELLIGADATYGESKFDNNDGTETDKVTAQNFRAFGQYNRLFNERLFGYFRVEGLHDKVADVDYRVSLSPGIGYYFIKNAETFLRAEAGPGYVFERVGGRNDDYMTLRLAERFEHKFNDKAKLWQSLELLPQIDDWNNFIANFEIGVETTLSKSFSLRTYLQDTYDNEPAPGRDENDLKLFAGVAYKF